LVDNGDKISNEISEHQLELENNVS